MAGPGKKAATYEDLINAPPHVIAELYAREGVAWAWLVEPLNHTLEVLQLGADQNWILRAAFRDDAVVRAPPFDAIELDLAILWADVVIPGAPTK